MTNPPFIEHVPIQTSIYPEFPIAAFDYQRVYSNFSKLQGEQNTKKCLYRVVSHANPINPHL